MNSAMKQLAADARHNAPEKEEGDAMADEEEG